LTFRAFMSFYVPLALTVLLMLLVMPLVSAALSRMPRALDSLAVWPVVFGFLIMWQSAGIAYNEAVIALLEKPRAEPRLRRFTAQLTMVTTILLGLIVVTPLSSLWFSHVAGLSPPLVDLARQTMWFGLLLPGLRVLQSWYQGAITYGRHTRGITEAFGISLLVSGLILWFGVAWAGTITGLFVGLVAVLAGTVTQTIWLWRRARPVLQAVRARDAAYPPLQTRLPARQRIT
jgi:hypothetical protein